MALCPPRAAFTFHTGRSSILLSTAACLHLGQLAIFKSLSFQENVLHAPSAIVVQRRDWGVAFPTAFNMCLPIRDQVSLARGRRGDHRTFSAPTFNAALATTATFLGKARSLA